MYRSFLSRFQAYRLGILFARNAVVHSCDKQFEKCRVNALLSIFPFSYNAKKSIGIACTFSGLLSLFQKKEDESELLTTIKRSVLLIQQGEMKKAEQMLHVALKLAQEQQNAQGVVYVLDLLANLSYEIKEYSKANKLFVSVLQHLLGTGVPKDDNKVIHISLKVADIYQKTGNNRKAEEGFKFCLDNLQSKFDAGIRDEDTMLLFAMTLDWYARFVLKLGRYKEAHDFFQKAYDMSIDLNGRSNEQTVVLLNDLGTVSCLQGDYDAALKYLNEAVLVGEALPDMSDFASIYVNLGNVYLKKQMFNEAKHACTSGWKNARAHKNKEGEYEADLCLEEIKNSANV